MTTVVIHYHDRGLDARQFGNDVNYQENGVATAHGWFDKPPLYGMCAFGFFSF